MSVTETRIIKGEKDSNWLLVGFIVLSLRFVQGWIFWAGGSRRFIYDPNKLDPYSTQWMANKLQSAMPGALLGFEQVISFLLQHFFLLYGAIIAFSLAELCSGLALILGLFTRFAACITVFISLILMIIFGWQGTTCMDEWTMAIANLAIGLTLVLTGSPLYSLDSWWQAKRPQMHEKKWFLLLASGPWSIQNLKKASLSFLVFTVLFTLSTYNYYRGAILSAYHPGPVSAYKYDLKLSDGRLGQDGTVTFTLYVDAGATASPANIVRIELLSRERKIIEEWDRKQLSIPANYQIKNAYAYNRITPGPYGIIAPVSAKATIILPPTSQALHVSENGYLLQIFTINGRRFDLILKQ